MVIVTSVTLVAVVTLLLLKTKTGKSVRAVAQNRHAAVLMGVNVNFVSSVVFGISSALGVAAGALIGALLALAPGVGESFAVKGFAQTGFYPINIRGIFGLEADFIADDIFNAAKGGDIALEPFTCAQIAAQAHGDAGARTKGRADCVIAAQAPPAEARR